MAATALTACLATEPSDVDDGVFGAMLEAIRERSERGLGAELCFAYGQLAQRQPLSRRDELGHRLAEISRRTATIWRGWPTAPRWRSRAAAARRGTSRRHGRGPALRSLLHAGLTGRGPDHVHTVRRLRLALSVAEALPELVAPADLESGLRGSLSPICEGAPTRCSSGCSTRCRSARSFDTRAARALPENDELVALAGELHVIGRAALVGEIARRDLAAGRAAVRAAVQDVIDRAPPES